MKIKIYRKVGIRCIELGDWWQIRLTRELIEDTTGSSFSSGIELVKHNYMPDLIKKVKHGNLIPFWYGYAYRDFDCDYSAFMPMPLNLIRAGWEWFKWHILFKFKSDWPHKLDQKHIDIRNVKQVIKLASEYPGISPSCKSDLIWAYETLDRLRAS